MRFIAFFASVFLAASLLSAQVATLPGDFQQAYITGTITADGHPVDRAEVFAVNTNGGEAMAMSASNGNYSLGVGAGSWKVMVSKANYLTPPPVDADVQGLQTQDNVNFDLHKATAYIEGTVVDESGAPLGGSVVVAMQANWLKGGSGGGAPPPMMGMGGAGSFPMAHCNSKGEFSLQVMPGNYLLIASRAGYRLSRKNPHPPIPGLENAPPQVMERLQSMPPMGVAVEVADNETKRGAVIILAPYQETPQGKTYGGTYHSAAPTPEPNMLIGKGCLTPNNVLHWTRARQNDNEQMLGYVVVRSTKPLTTKLNRMTAVITTFRFPFYPYGTPATHYYSFTDSTAKPGAVYYYYVYEMGAKGSGPYSNGVKIITL